MIGLTNRSENTLVTRLLVVPLALGLLCACSGRQHGNLKPALLGEPRDTCDLLASMLTTRVGCNALGCFPALREIDCIEVLSGREGVGIPVSVVFLDPQTGVKVPALREGEHCGSLLSVHRSIENGVEQFVTIELKPKSQTVVEFLAELTVVTKEDGRVTGHGGTACSGVRSGEVRKEGSSWITYTR